MEGDGVRDTACLPLASRPSPAITSQELGDVRTTDARPTPGRWLLALGAAVGALLVWSSPALALRERGHVFGFSFGSEGSAEGQFFSPSGVALNEATQDVYVVDRANNRVEEFGPKGEFILTWGWGVKDGKNEFEVCAREHKCRAGLSGPGDGQLKSPKRSPWTTRPANRANCTRPRVTCTWPRIRRRDNPSSRSSVPTVN